MKNEGLRQQVLLGVLLVLASVFVYMLHFLIFRDLHHIFLYLIGDIAFVFIEVLLVTLVIHNILNQREKRAVLAKLNMVIGAFFSEVGVELLKSFSSFDGNAGKMRDRLVIRDKWTTADFAGTRKFLEEHDSAVNWRAGDLNGLREFMIRKREFLLGLLENPNLLEHEQFTELLWAVFHLADELAHRVSVENLSQADGDHLAGDIRRAYKLLIREWIAYMEHLKGRYPYLFSLAMRTNPFDNQAQVEIKGGQ